MHQSWTVPANRVEKQILGGCSAPTRSSCSSNTVVRLFAGDVVRLEIEDGFLVRNIFNSFSGHQVPEYHSNIMQRSVSDCEYRADTCQSICSAICQSAISAHRTTTTTAQGHILQPPQDSSTTQQQTPHRPHSQGILMQDLHLHRLFWMTSHHAAHPL